jgi:hypothetical protein
MDWTNRIHAEWPELAIVVIMLLAGFSVPILGPLRAWDSRVIIALAVLLLGAGLALLVERAGRPEPVPLGETTGETSEP